MTLYRILCRGSEISWPDHRENAAPRRRVVRQASAARAATSPARAAPPTPSARRPPSPPPLATATKPGAAVRDSAREADSSEVYPWGLRRPPAERTRCGGCVTRRCPGGLGYHMDSAAYGAGYFIDEIQRRLPALTVDDVNAAKPHVHPPGDGVDLVRRQRDVVFVVLDAHGLGYFAAATKYPSVKISCDTGCATHRAHCQASDRRVHSPLGKPQILQNQKI